MKRCWLRPFTFTFAVILFGVSGARAIAAENLRYLFLIDHSPEMATRQIATVQTIYDTIRSGFENGIKPGEHFALWFYGSRLQTNAPFIWQPGQETALARQAANLFTGRIYSRLRPREQTLADAAPFIGASPQITIFIITDGSQPLAGTPFDAKINAAISEKRTQFRMADKPFVITLMARRGNWVDATVFTSATDQFQVPEFDRQDETMAQALAAVRSAPAPTTPNLDAVEMDKALAALRNAPATAPQNPGDGNEIDKARSALRDALSGNKAPASQTAPKMQITAALREPQQSNPVEKPNAEERKPQTNAAALNTQTDKPVQSLPPTIARPPETVAIAQPAPEPKATEPKPVEAPNVVAEQPKPVTQEQPKPTVHDDPKLIVREDPKPAVQEPPKTLAQKITSPPPQPAPIKIVEQPKPTPPKQAEAPRTNLVHRAVQNAVVIPPAKPFPWLLLSLGFLSIVVGGGFALSRVIQRSKSPGSIITQALPRSGPRVK